MKKLILIVFLFPFAFSSCKKDADPVSYDQQLAIDKQTIDNYLTGHGILAESDDSGFRYVVLKQGTGTKPTETSTVDVRITGRFLAGNVFLNDTTAKKLALTSLITGLRTGIQLMQRGSKYTFYLPSGLAYGPYATTDGTIPANSILVFDVTLIDDIAQTAIEDAAIDAALSDSTNVIKDETTGLRSIIIKDTDGPSPTGTSNVTLNYTVSLLNGHLYATETNVVFNLSNTQILAFWIYALPQMQLGERRIVYVPSTLAFGPDGYSDGVAANTIPPNTTLVYDITLKFVN